MELPKLNYDNPYKFLASFGVLLIVLGIYELIYPIIIIGVILIMKGSSRKQPREVPIYEGKNVVGYRRHKK